MVSGLPCFNDDCDLDGAQHFMTKMGAPGSAEERFVDVFRGGVLLTRCAQPGDC